jgi:hypothetical protein
MPLRRAPAVIARGGRFAHPSVWAPFALVGNGEQYDVSAALQERPFIL